MTLAPQSSIESSEALMSVVNRANLVDAAKHAGNAAAMQAMMHATNNPKEDVWRDEADVWVMRRDHIVMQEPFRTAAAMLAGTCYCEAYQNTYIDLTAPQQ